MRALSIADINNYKPKTIPFSGDWLASYGEPELTGAWLIWGNSGNGKTRHALQLAKYLAQFGRVAYNTLEEGLSLSMKNALEGVGMIEVKRRFILLDKEPISELKKRLEKQKSPDIIFIDSLQYTGLSYNEYIELKDTFRKKLFVLVSHADGKMPAGRVARSIRYDAFVKIWVEGYMAYPVGRYGGGEPYVIWEHGAKQYGNL